MGRRKPGTLVRLCTEDEMADIDEVNDLRTAYRDAGLDSAADSPLVTTRYLPASHPDNEFRHPTYECIVMATGVRIQVFPYEITTRRLKEQTHDGADKLLP